MLVGVFMLIVTRDENRQMQSLQMSLHVFLKIKLLGEEYFQVHNEYVEETKR